MKSKQQKNSEAESLQRKLEKTALKRAKKKKPKMKLSGKSVFKLKKLLAG